MDLVYGSRSGSDGAPLSESEDRDLDRHGPDDMAAVGMELSGQVIRRRAARIRHSVSLALI